jgi:hypothetical protein
MVRREEAYASLKHAVVIDLEILDPQSIDRPPLPGDEDIHEDPTGFGVKPEIRRRLSAEQECSRREDGDHGIRPQSARHRWSWLSESAMRYR